MKKMKKPTVAMLVAVMISSNGQGLVAYANEEVTKNKLEVKEETREDKSEKITDITPPAVEISSLKIDKKEVKPGERVNISIKATDDMSGIDYINVWYDTPITGKQENIRLSYNSATDRYEGSMYIDENKEAGLWEIDCIYAIDNLDNEVYIKNSNTNNYGDIREDLSSGNFNVSGTDTDVTPPAVEISSLKIDKKEVKPGERVNISIKATDDMSGIDYINVWYDTPITGKQENIRLSYNSTTDRYEGSMYIDENKEAGLWEIDCIYAIDNLENSIYIHNSNTNSYEDIREDLSSGNFNVNGTDTDVTPPAVEISSLKIDKKEVKPGERVNISIKATDDMSGIDYINVWYDTPITGKRENIRLSYNSTTDRYEGSMYIDENKEAGLWEIDCIYAIDNLENSIYIHNSNTNSYEDIREDLSSGNFNVQNDDSTVKPIEGVSVVTKNESWSNKTINGDLYIGPEAILTVSENVRVTGNIYVLGALKINGGLTINGILHGTSMSWGGSTTLNNGTIVISGSNSIGSMNMSNYPVQDIPVRVDNAPLVATDGIIDIKGATVNVADMYIEGKKIDLDYKGRFDIKGINIGVKNKVTIEFKTVFGNTITKTYDVDNDQTPIVPTNRVPEISASDVEIKVGEKFNPLSGASAKDYEDGDISDRVEVIENTVDTSKAGVYKVVYKVTDSKGASATKEIKVTVVQGLVVMNKVPEISASDIEIKVGEKFNPLNGVSAKDYEDGDISDKIEVIENTLDTGKAGVYKVVYKVTDSQGASITKEITVTVSQGLVGINRVPEISASDIEIKVGEEFNPLSVVTAKDYEDGDISDRVEVIENTVNTNKAGEYKVVYKSTDSKGASTTKEIKVTVKDKIEFSDTKGHWAEKTINSFVDKGFINGYEDKTFKPDNNMTRAEFVRVVNNVFGYDQKGTEQFDDVNENDWFYSDICIGINMGYINGKSKDSFAPNDNITRQEVAMILTNIKNNKDNNLDKLNLFKDGHQTDEWAKSSVEGAIESGYLNGYEDKTIRAKGNITRAEAISMLSRVK